MLRGPEHVLPQQPARQKQGSALGAPEEEAQHLEDRDALWAGGGEAWLFGGWDCIRGSAGASPAAQHVLPPCGTSQGSFSIDQGAKLPREVESRVGPCWEVPLVHQEREPGLVWIQEVVNSWFCRQLGNMSC